MRRLRVLTWHIHGNYLYYLSQADVDFYIPYLPGGRAGFGGRGATFPFGANVIEVPASAIRDVDVDCLLFQTRTNYQVDQYEFLSESQRRKPRVYLEHDPPQEHPFEQRHWFDEPEGLLVHVTHFNALMWNSGRVPTRVIEHGVLIPDEARYRGDLTRGLVVVNHLRRRGRRLGADVFEQARARVPLDLVGMDAESLGGLGEVFPLELPSFLARYRFFFNPIRWTSLGLAIVEAMMVGLPIVGLATTELSAVIRDGESGYLSTSLDRLIEAMRALLDDPATARRLGDRARQQALERFHINRFARDWEHVFAEVVGRPSREGLTVAPGLVVS